ncbi:MAG: MFS transporter [Candidatus Shapirobacteria bacterium]|nr:MFS transporter [Candidatus Shapirobacteria bacterium]
MKKINLPAVFENKNFRLLLAVQLCSNIAATIILFSIINIVFLEVQSSSVIALITLLYYLPGTFLGILAGTVVDKVNKRKIFIVSSLCQAVIALFFLLIKNHVFLAFPLVLFYSLFDEFFNPAVAAILPNIVKKENLGEANTLWFFTTQGSFAFGSLISGIILSLARNYQLVFPFVSLMLIAGTIVTVFIPEKILNHSKNLKGAWEDFNPEELLTDIRDSIFFLKNNKLVLFPILFLTLTQTFIGTAITIAPVLAQTLNIAITSTSLFIVTPGIIGAIVGGAWVSQAIKKKQFRKKSLIIRGLLFSGITLSAIFLATFSSLAPYFVWVLIIGLGLFAILAIIPTKTLIQEHSPFEIRGRVYGVLNMLISLAGMLPLLLVASLVDLLGARAVILITGLALIGLSQIINKNQSFLFKQIKKHD